MVLLIHVDSARFILELPRLRGQTLAQLDESGRRIIKNLVHTKDAAHKGSFDEESCSPDVRGWGPKADSSPAFTHVPLLIAQA
jgi:hypothetical protein